MNSRMRKFYAFLLPISAVFAAGHGWAGEVPGSAFAVDLNSGVTYETPVKCESDRDEFRGAKIYLANKVIQPGIPVTELGVAEERSSRIGIPSTNLWKTTFGPGPAGMGSVPSQCYTVSSKAKVQKIGNYLVSTVECGGFFDFQSFFMRQVVDPRTNQILYIQVRDSVSPERNLGHPDLSVGYISFLKEDRVNIECRSDALDPTILAVVQSEMDIPSSDSSETGGRIQQNPAVTTLLDKEVSEDEMKGYLEGVGAVGNILKRQGRLAR